MVFHAHKEFTDKLNLKDVANKFVGVAECRLFCMDNLNSMLDL